MRTAPALIALSAACALALAGCGSGGGDSSGQDPEAQAEQSAPAGQGGQEGAPAAPEADVADVPEVVAVVNGEEISRDEFVSNYEGQLQQSAMQSQQTGEEVDQTALKQQVAQMLVDNRLLTQAADDAGIEASEEDIDATLSDIAAQNGMGSAEEVVTALGEQGLSEEQIREDAASQYRVNTFISEEADIEAPSEEELREQYDGYAAQMEQAGGQGGQQPAEVPPFEEIRDQLAEQMVSQQQNAAAQEIVAGLGEDADVTINL
ncbi:SurA N-terminal domain-containing protein [Brevibacterium album]|uniref:SurA N-terminal domain-containing protein n=1 Tax=Brevibacterium album TaxID=417948 RepID=UPI000406643E|nr:SurA N-terminal domain-containing protein [Brevibacterium album]